MHAYTDIKDHKKALELHQKVYEQRIEVLGSEHRQTVHSLFKTGSCYEDLGDIEKATEIYEKVLEIRTRVWGADHRDTVKIREKLNELKG